MHHMSITEQFCLSVRLVGFLDLRSCSEIKQSSSFKIICANLRCFLGKCRLNWTYCCRPPVSIWPLCLTFPLGIFMDSRCRYLTLTNQMREIHIDAAVAATSRTSLLYLGSINLVDTRFDDHSTYDNQSDCEYCHVVISRSSRAHSCM